MNAIDQVLEKVFEGERIGPEEGLLLLRSRELQKVGQAADCVRRRHHPDGVVSFLIDRNINYTNVCVARCTFCNFYRRPGDDEGYVLPLESIFKKIEETIDLGGTGILMQGGMHPDLKIEYYEKLLGSIRERYQIHLHCFSPPEIVVLAKLSRISIRESIRRLKAAGLASIPGGGAEILVERMRKSISPGKCSAQEWLEVMRVAHEEGLSTTGTMMIGGGETLGRTYRASRCHPGSSGPDRRFRSVYPLECAARGNPNEELDPAGGGDGGVPDASVGKPNLPG